jgi:hypothetical protein
MDDVGDTIELLKAHIAAHSDEDLAQSTVRVARH